MIFATPLAPQGARGRFVAMIVARISQVLFDGQKNCDAREIFRCDIRT
jgi:hypothetical protein